MAIKRFKNPKTGKTTCRSTSTNLFVKCSGAKKKRKKRKKRRKSGGLSGLATVNLGSIKVFTNPKTGRPTCQSRATKKFVKCPLSVKKGHRKGGLHGLSAGGGGVSMGRIGGAAAMLAIGAGGVWWLAKKKKKVG